MEIRAWLTQTEKTLSTTGTGRLDALVLLEDAMGKDRAHLLAHPELVLTKKQQNVLNSRVARRAQHEPLAYIRGKTEFYGREFIVSPAVLEPRPESETMIELLLQLQDLPPKPIIADVGCGSGALGITAKLELEGSSVDLLDIDDACLKVAKLNVIKFATSINITNSDLLARSSQQYDILLCNLPYIPDTHTINEAALHEPKLAIFGGPDGLDIYQKLFKQVEILRTKPLLILTESLPPQHKALNVIATLAGYAQKEASDFIQVFKRL